MIIAAPRTKGYLTRGQALHEDSPDASCSTVHDGQCSTNSNKIKVKMMRYALLTSISKKNDSNKHQTSNSHNSKDKNVFKISP